jgi:uncharacterized protein
MTLPLPDVSDPDYAPHFEAVRRGVLAVPECVRCGRKHWPPRPTCPACGDAERRWVEVPGRGRLYSWVTTWRTTIREFEQDLPFVVGVVELDTDDLIRFLGRVVDYEEDSLAMDMPVELTVHQVTDEVSLPYWRPSTAGPAT